MCGILGFNWADKALLKKSHSKTVHRGPDQAGYFVDDKISLAHNRLSIIDLSEKGKQPMTNADGSIVIVFNGEIYNYQSLKKDLEPKYKFNSKTDTEVIIHGYEEEGISFVKKLNGIFAFAIYDTNKQKLYLVRDRLGVKPLYYHYNPETNKLFFASEIKAILEDKSIKREVNQNSFLKYITLRYTTGNETMFNSIYKVPYGHYIEYDYKTSSLSSHKYWDLSPVHFSDSNYSLKKVDELVDESVKMQMISDVPIGVFLSGGIDSSIVTSLVSKYSDNVKTFSIGFHSERTDETMYSRQVADHFGTEHHEFIVDEDMLKYLPKVVYHFDEPIADPAALPTYLLAENTSKYVKVVLAGEGADEIFAGYEQFKMFILYQKLKNYPQFIKSALPKTLKHIPKSLIDKFVKSFAKVGEEEIKRFEEIMTSNNSYENYMRIISVLNKDSVAEVSGKSTENHWEMFPEIKKHFDQYENTDLVHACQNVELFNFLPDNLLMKVDKMTMAHSIEARVPFLNHKLVENVMSFSSKNKLDMKNEKIILKKLFKKKLPPDITKRKKHRFVLPIDDWVNGEYKDYVWDTIEKGVKRNHFQESYINKVKRNYNKSAFMYARQAWNMLNFELWYDTFIENQ